MSEYVFAKATELHEIESLPDPFLKVDGTRVSSPKEWPEQREYLKAMLEHYLYGSMPLPPAQVVGQTVSTNVLYEGAALEETVQITADDKVQFKCRIIRPKWDGRVPVITWNQFPSRQGSPIERQLIQSGYAVAEFDREQLAKDGAEALCGPLAQAYPQYGWGTIAMWAWGHSRVIDYLATTVWADMDKIVATGHSRGGKVALCSAIYDERVAVCVASGSGCCGAGCLRYMGGRLGEGHSITESLGSMEDAFPYWWADELGNYGKRSLTHTRSNALPESGTPQILQKLDPQKLGQTQNEWKLPFDCHFLRACIAPRALLTTDGMADTWSNPFGTQISWRASDDVFEFVGALGKNAMVMRDGGHEFAAIDWEMLLSFCNYVFYQTPLDYRIQSRAPCQESDAIKKQAQEMAWYRERLHCDWTIPR